MTKTILVAVDESEGSRRACAFVDRFFGDADVSITAVNVTADPTAIPPVVPFGVPYGGVYGWGWGLDSGAASSSAGTADERQRALAQAERVAARQAPAGAQAEARFGDPVEAISDAADDVDADLIVVGSDDRGFLDRLVGGSVSRDLVKDASRPVLLVRWGRDQAGGPPAVPIRRVRY